MQFSGEPLGPCSQGNERKDWRGSLDICLARLGLSNRTEAAASVLLELRVNGHPL